MARSLRLVPSNGVFHVYARGNAQAKIFLTDVDRLVYLKKLGLVAKESEWRCLVAVESDEQFRAVAVYIARNPVEAGLCEHPDQWMWSSYRATIIGHGPDWLDRMRLLSFFGADDRAARISYARLCGDEPI